MLLLSLKAGLRACEISQLTWSMVLDAEGDVADAILLENAATKGNKGGRKVYLHDDLREALVNLMPTRRVTSPGTCVVHSERGKRLSANSICNWFASFYRNVGFAGCTSHSGRRTFITNAAKKIVTVGGSLRDVQELAGHASLQTTQSYIEGDTAAKQKVIQLI